MEENEENDEDNEEGWWEWTRQGIWGCSEKNAESESIPCKIKNDKT